MSSVNFALPETMTDFCGAIRAMQAGAKVTKAEWNNRDFYGQLRNGVLMIHLADGWHQWIVSDGDIEGLDWFAIS